MTLDPLVRQVQPARRRELLVSDTVGFIDRLPHSLVAAFRATLEEVAAADLLLHVIDASDARSRSRRWTRSAACSPRSAPIDVPMLEVYNKCDQLDARERAGAFASLHPGALVRLGADRRRARRARRGHARHASRSTRRASR